MHEWKSDERSRLCWHLGSVTSQEISGAACLSHLDKLRGKNENFIDVSSEKKTLFALLNCSERKEQLFEGAEKYGMVEIVPEEEG